ncbi:MAG: hypothetical protein M4579_001969 [Chaenotheca gracillima]|nr:MAG: hypothetical protein M4579_001969 [Chaenotheca gracillima]
MSADLFAAFGDDQQKWRSESETQLQAQPSQAFQEQEPGFYLHSKENPHDTGVEDDWGAFESPHVDGTQRNSSPPGSRTWGLFDGGGFRDAADYEDPAVTATDAWGDFGGTSNATSGKPAVAPSSERDSGLQNVPGPTFRQASQYQEENDSTSWRRGGREPEAYEDPDLLFDAEAEMKADQDHREEEDDDFGDFETAHSDITEIGKRQTTAPTASWPAKQTSPPVDTPALDLLSLDTAPVGREGHSNGRGSQQDRFSQSLLDDVPKPSVVHETERKFQDENDDFGDWDAFTEGQPTTILDAEEEHNQDIPASGPGETFTEKKNAPMQFSPAPTNIPPPSLLLSLFPYLLSSYMETSPLFTRTATTTSLKTRIKNSPATTIPSLKTHIANLTALSYLLAGRSLRWKRDTHLSQSLRIGPAASSAGRGGGGGMKLTQVSRGESVQEDREVAEIAHLIQEQVGRVRSAVGAVNAVHPGTVAGVPDVSAAATKKEVRTVTAAEGGVQAENGKPCALCGLKREERVRGVDDVGGTSVEDSFGEWWVDFWGHRACAEFWEGNKERLRQR